MNKLQLELHVDDFRKVKDYYLPLGFEIVWERKPEGYKGYLVLDLNGNTLCFWGGNEHIYKQSHFQEFDQQTPHGYGVEVVLMVKDIHKFHEDNKERLNIVEDLKLQPWGLWDFRATDPFGYYLRFTSEHDVYDPSFAVE